MLKIGFFTTRTIKRQILTVVLWQFFESVVVIFLFLIVAHVDDTVLLGDVDQVAGTSPAATTKGVWWWRGNNAATDPAEATRRLDFLSAHGVDEIYFCVDLRKLQKEPNWAVISRKQRALPTTACIFLLDLIIPSVFIIRSTSSSV